MRAVEKMLIAALRGEPGDPEAAIIELKRYANHLSSTCNGLLVHVAILDERLKAVNEMVERHIRLHIKDELAEPVPAPDLDALVTTSNHALRLEQIDWLMTGDPDPESPQGKLLIELAEAVEAYEVEKVEKEKL